MSIIETIEPHMPKDKTRYLMGVGTPSNIIEGVARGVDFFDCVMPARNARHAKVFTWSGSVNLQQCQVRARTMRPLDPDVRLPRLPPVYAARICVICSRPRRCWPCALRSCTIFISTTN